MKLVEKIDNTLRFEPENNEEAGSHREFLEVVSNYRIVRQGSRVLFYNLRSTKLDACMNIGDNSFFIAEADGFRLGNFFGTKRFIVGSARQSVNEAVIGQEKLINFGRDRSFSLQDSKQAEIPFKVVFLQTLLEIRKSNLDALYGELADLFNRCADFTPGKQKEYIETGEKTDKLKRFNPENNAGTQDSQTVQTFLLDSNNKVVGTCSALIVSNQHGKDIYVYDEIVDYFIKLNHEEKLAVIAKADELRKIEARIESEKDHAVKAALETEKEAMKKSLAAIIDPKRAELMLFLFQAMRQQIWQALREMQPGFRAFIRAAADRTEMYKALGCSDKNEGQFVIHGPRTEYAKIVDAHLSKWAETRLFACCQTPQFSNAAAIAALRYGSTTEAAAANTVTPDVAITAKNTV